MPSKLVRLIPAVLIQLLATLQFALAADSRTEGVLTTELKERVFRATLKDGYHFNEKAPNSVRVDDKVLKPAKLAAREAVFTSLPVTWSKGHAALYVCDDAITFCEPRFIELKGTGAVTASAPVSTNAHKGKINSHGFIEDDFSKALAVAAKSQKLVLIDFSARWCPGCLRFENETFDTKDFKRLTKDYVKLKIDVDRFENNVLSEKFNVKAIPTLLVVNGAQDEVDRLVDFQPNDVLERFFAAIKSDPTTIAELKSKAAMNDPAILTKLGQRLVMANRFDDALAPLAQVKPVPPEYWSALVGSARAAHKADASTKPKLIQALKDAIAAESATSRSIGWRNELAGLIDDKNQVVKLRAEGLAVADGLLADPAKLKDGVKTDLVGEFTGYEPLMVAMARADLVESTGTSSAESAAAWNLAADKAQALKIQASRTGPALRAVIILTKAERYEEANKILGEMLKRDPGSPELLRRRLRALVGLKKFPEAVSIGERVLKSSYGRNEFWVAEVLAKAYIGAKQNVKAQTLIDTYLGRSDIEWSNLQSSRKTLETLKAQLAQQAVKE